MHWRESFVERLSLSWRVGGFAVEHNIALECFASVSRCRRYRNKSGRARLRMWLQQHVPGNMRVCEQRSWFNWFDALRLSLLSSSWVRRSKYAAHAYIRHTHNHTRMGASVMSGIYKQLYHCNRSQSINCDSDSCHKATTKRRSNSCTSPCVHDNLDSSRHWCGHTDPLLEVQDQTLQGKVRK